MPTKEASKILPKKIDLDYSVKDGFNQIEPKSSLRRLDTSIGRTYYNPDDKDRKYIYSSTTILNVLSKGYGFNTWLKTHGNDCDRLMNEAATKGTIIHICCSVIAGGDDLHTNTKFYDKGKSYEITKEIYTNVLAFKKFYQENRPVIKAIELTLYDRNLPFAGTADYIMILEGKDGQPKLCLLDIKTGKEYPKTHELQLVSYKILFDSIYGDEHGTIDEMYCLYLKDTGNYKLKKYRFNDQEWISTLHLFHYMNSNAYGKMPKIKEEFQMDEIITLKENENEPRK
tara:strand:+ start:453 stop:1307 length:855 start_codon:yes stop_codon:yes gene_type:complete